MEVWLTWRELNAWSGVATKEWKAICLEQLIQRSQNVTVIIVFVSGCFVVLMVFLLEEKFVKKSLP